MAKGNKKWLRHPNGVEVAVRAEDAEQMAVEIELAHLREHKKAYKITILDAPTYEGGEKGVDPVSRPATKSERMAAAIAKALLPSVKGK